ncbi:hypothetical protein LTR36_006911 [Oleoguttula mirabilis]|uniref:Uncharacterized protein n=1 Tax=Oleoguttula mirabilis TaxID=1507867 RepID=A0AAV9JBR9_9PEZI|nr:hypothetical protein LTR36_006911 [Oleoguttula mirabilis]
MSAAIMNPSMQAPHRKPLPGYHAAPAGHSAGHGNAVIPQQPQQYAPEQGYARTQSIAGGMPPNGSPAYGMNQPQQTAYGQSARRTLSNATSSTSSTSTNTGLQRAPTTSSFTGAANAPRRSTSSRSTASASPTSYVALMRKQKATVWCDRAQHEDPRILAAQRAAKMRAAMEVAGGQKHAPLGGRTSTSSSGMVGGVRSKIRHHGAPKASTYTGGANLAGGVGVPMRLSASEVDEGDSDEEPGSQYANRYHSRTGSGRSSLSNGRRAHSGFLSAGTGYSNGSTPPNGHSPVENMGDLMEEETPVPVQYGQQADDYFQQSGGQGSSGSSIEREEKFGGIGGLPPSRATVTVEQHRKTSDELRRRGSVDDRTTTMSGVRLFVANPDLSD